MLRRYAFAAVAGLAVISIDARAAIRSDRPTSSLPAALSLEAAQAALAACKAQGATSQSASSTVWGYLQILIVGDGASPTGRTLAPRKAYTSAAATHHDRQSNQRVSVPGAFNPLQFRRAS